MRRNEGLTVVVAALVTLVSAVSVGAQPPPVAIGAVYPLSGPTALKSRSAVDGLRMGVEDVNAAGGIKSLGGATLRLEVVDHGGNARTAAAQTERLIREGMAIVLGAGDDPATLATSGTAERLRTPFLAPESTDGKITARTFSYVFRLPAPIGQHAQSTLAFLDEVSRQGRRRVASIGIMVDEADHENPRLEALKLAAEHTGLDIALMDFPARVMVSATPLVIRMKNREPDALVILAPVRPAVLIWKTMAEQKFRPLAVIGDPVNCGSDDYRDGLGNLAESSFCVSGWSADLRLPGVDVTGIARRFKERSGNPLDSAGSFTYTAAWVVKEVLEKAGSLDKGKIREAFTGVEIALGNPHNLLPNAIRFGANGQNIHARQIMTQVLKGQVRAVWPPELASTQPLFPAPPFR